MEDLSMGARIAIGLIVLGVIISVVFTILGFTRGTTNQGLNSVQNSMDQMSLSQFDDYDQKIVSGTQVKSAIKLFSGNAVAVCVKSAAEEKAEPGTFYNYGAVLSGTTATEGSIAVQKVKFNAMVTGESWWVGSYAGNPITYNLDCSNVIVSGTNAYIRPTGKFMSELIKDNTGTIIGIAFRQL